MLIDTHAHLNEPAFAEKINAVVSRAKKVGIDACVVPAYDGDSLGRTDVLARDYPRFIFPAYGIHPWFVADFIKARNLTRYMEHGNAVAVGEIGLDFGFEFNNVALQIQVLKEQLNMAIAYHLPVILHCRKAFDLLYQILAGHQAKIRGVMHSFSGSPEMMKNFLNLGLYVSFSGSVTRKSARKYHKNAQMVPSDRYLIETDAPSIATESTVASNVEPMHLGEIVQKMAELRSRNDEDICRESSENARRLFNIKTAS
jgi:TatD DNase family protein